MNKFKVCVEQYHDLAASLLQTGGGEGREDDFFMAIERGDVEGVKCILSSIQPLDIKSWVNLKKADETRDTPLIIAASRGYPELVKLLIQMGADPTVTNANNITSLHVTKDNCRELIIKSATRTPSKTTALITSSWLGNKFTVEDILKRGQVDVNTRNLDYFTPLLLVTRDIQIFDKISFDDTVEYDPVHVAAELISYNTNVMKACDDLGRNAVHLAAGHTGPTAQKLVDLLLNNCVDEEVELKDSRANTPLHYATQSGDREIEKGDILRYIFL
ncbi:Microtubule-associated protein futsch-like [Oopsacas minuta]|uniref:Microtubule-associated protein futsch-like n=1 Tax=Oopsacas minuta TaxID=111878 RepID=A0AAV7KMK4_9METZ|nr:Microtubule-associated protein futsch-like [Oopsacas minuta]